MSEGVSLPLRLPLPLPLAFPLPFGGAPIGCRSRRHNERARSQGGLGGCEGPCVGGGLVRGGGPA